MKTMTVTYDIAGSVIIDEVSSETTFTSQLHSDGSLITFFPNGDGVLVTKNGGDTHADQITTTRHGKVYRTVQTRKDYIL